MQTSKEYCLNTSHDWSTGDAVWCPDGDSETVDVIAPIGANRASATYYNSYAACCPDNPNYDPNAPTEECDWYSACSYPGVFAYIPPQSYEWVEQNNIIAFFSSNGDNESYRKKCVQLTKGDVSFVALIADTCGDHDCGGCCSNNANSDGYLVDIEYETVMRNFGSTAVVHGNIFWELVECGDLSGPANYNDHAINRSKIQKVLGVQLPVETTAGSHASMEIIA